MIKKITDAEALAVYAQRIMKLEREREELRQNLAGMVRAFGGKYPIKSDKGFTLNLARAMLGRVTP